MTEKKYTIGGFTITVPAGEKLNYEDVSALAARARSITSYNVKKPKTIYLQERMLGYLTSDYLKVPYDEVIEYLEQVTAGTYPSFKLKTPKGDETNENPSSHNLLTRCAYSSGKCVERLQRKLRSAQPHCE